MDVRKGGAWVSPTTAEAFVGGTWRTLKYAEAYYSGAWRQIVSFVAAYTALSISPSPASASSFTSDTITSGAIVATPNGGLSPFTYSWVLVSSSGLTGITINSPSYASTTFTASTVAGGVGSSGTATFRCTGTDALGTSQSATVNVSFEHSGSTGGA
jgi:hypothetical protein